MKDRFFADARSFSLTAAGVAVIAAVACGACGGNVDAEAPAPCPTTTATTAPPPDAGTATPDAGGTPDSGAPPTSDAGTPTGGDSGATDAGAPVTGQSLSTGPSDFCVVAPWTNSPQQFVSSAGATTLPGGAYTLRYVGGAQNHDEYQQYGGNFEVSAQYTIDGLEAGHHLYDGADPSSSTTSIWLDATGLVGDLPDVPSVEQANAGHTWPVQLAGGPLFITYYDNDYSDNIGPGSQLCIDTSAPQLCAPTQTTTLQITSTVPWSDSGIDIAAGWTVAMQATGTVVYGTLSGSTADANGGNFDGTMLFPSDVFPNTVTHSLIGKVGGTTDVGTGTALPEGVAGDGAGFVGTSYSEVTPAGGRLFLGYNDESGAFGDNVGSFTVTVVTSPPASCGM